MTGHAPALLALVGALLLASPAGAQRYARDWSDLSPDEQRRAWDNYQRYQQLPQNRRDQYDQRFQRYQAMPPQEQQRLRQNYDQYRGQDPAARELFNQKYRRWKERGGR